MAMAEMSGGGFSAPNGRRYDLDWLRAIAFGLLIFYHVGMFYVTWGWHVKSAYAGPGAEPLMQIVNPWRLALLFFISGAAVRFASDKAASRRSFVASRSLRLGLPILAGMIVTVAPQSYFQLRQAGLIEPGYMSFWGDYLNLKQLYPMITPTWNHLWYVVYLLVYILLITPLLPMMRWFAEGRGGGWVFAIVTGGPARLLILTVIPFVFYEQFLSPRFPVTHALWGDWANHAHRFSIFLLGYFAAKNMTFWRSVDRAWPLAIATAITLGAVQFFIRENADLVFSGDWRVWSVPTMRIVGVYYAWSCILALLGVAQRWLNRPSKALSYFTGAVFCYYILHQTIIIVAGYYLTQLRLGLWPEFLIVTTITVAGCAIGFEVVRRIRFLRIFFGVKGAPIAENRSVATHQENWRAIADQGSRKGLREFLQCETTKFSS